MKREELSVILPVLGKLLYTYPDEGFLANIKDAGIFESIPYESDNAEFHKGRQLLEGWQASDGEYDKCITDYQDLFVGVRGRVKVPAWESIYRAPEPMMFGECTLDARLWYDKYGLEIKNVRHEPDDHMGIELIFFAHLLKEDPDNADRFFKEHIGRWYESFFFSMAANAESSLYKGLALLLHAVCGDIAKALSAEV